MSEIIVPWALYDVEDPWWRPERCQPIRLRRSNDGLEARLATTVVAYRDAELLTVVFAGSDHGIVANHFEHDAPLYEEDVVEIFMAPETSSQRYFEIEVSPHATVFDASVHSPDGVRATMSVDRSWTCEGLFAAVRRTPDTLEVVIRIPFQSVVRHAPREGDRWRANFFRIDRDPAAGDEFQAWRPTWKSPPDFHVAASFGTLRFAGR